MIQTKKEYTQKSYQEVTSGYKREIEFLKQTIQERNDFINELKSHIEVLQKATKTINTGRCACGSAATSLVGYKDGEVEPVCEDCLQAKKEWVIKQGE